MMRSLAVAAALLLAAVVLAGGAAATSDGSSAQGPDSTRRSPSIGADEGGRQPRTAARSGDLPFGVGE